jgi:membrane-bound lytic murein transglycosylase D
MELNHNSTQPGVPRLRTGSFCRICRVVIAATAAVALAGLAGCEDSARRPVTYRPPQAQRQQTQQTKQTQPAQQTKRAQQAQQSQRTSPANRPPVPVPASPSTAGVQSRATEGPEQVAKQAEAAFAAGEQSVKAGNLETARQQFDRALDLLLESGYDLDTDARLAPLFRRIVEAAHNDELAALQEGDASAEQKSEPAPIDEIAAEGAPEAPVDPSLRKSAEGELAAVPHDLPLTVNDIVLSYLNYFQTARGRAIVETGLRRAGRYRAMIESVLQQEGLPNDLIYLAQAESAFQPQALSKAGARGLWQFMSYRGQEYGLDHSWWLDERQDPQKATVAAARHLKDLYRMFGDWYLVMAAYNAGPGAVQHAVERTGYADFWQLYKLNALPKETKNYVPIILAMTLIAKDPARYGVDVDPEAPIRTDTVRPGHSIDLRLVAETIDVDLDTVRMLNPQLLRLVTPADAGFTLHLPEGTAERFSTEIAAIPPDKWISWRRHKVGEGETLSAIARQFRVSTTSIADVNGLDADAPLGAGAKLIIPVAPQSETSLGKLVRYKARRNDTLASVANEFDVTVAELKKWNHLRSDKLAPNARLKIYPGGTGPAPSEKARGTSTAAVSRVAAKSAPAESASAAAERVETVSDSSRGNRASKSGAAVAQSASSGASTASSGASSRVAAQRSSSRPVIHKVQAGETLYSIARAYQTSVDALRNGNRFLFSRSLEAGDTLTIVPQVR